MLWSQNHKSNTKSSIGTGGKYPDLLFLYSGVVKGKGNLSALALAYPVPLHYFYPLWPVNAIMFHKLIGIFGDAEEPLLQISPTHCGTTALTEAPAHYLFISQHRLAVGAPVNRSLAPISQISIVKLQEEPLCPLVVLRQAGNYLSTPVVDSAYALELTAHVFDILHRPGKGMNAPLDSGILGGQTKGIETHRVKYIITLQSLKSGVNIRWCHGIPVPDMEVARGIGEHSQCIKFGAGVILSNFVEPILGPLLLPLLLYFLRVIPGYHLSSHPNEHVSLRLFLTYTPGSFS